MDPLPPPLVLDAQSSGATFEWEALTSLPFDDWEHGKLTSGVREWVQKASNFLWSPDDEHFIQPQYTTAVLRLMRVIATTCSRDLDRLNEERVELERSVASAREAEETFRARADLLQSESNQLRAMLEQKEGGQSETEGVVSPHHHKSAMRGARDARRLKEELEKSTRDVDRLRRENKELQQALQQRNAVKTQAEREDEKFRLEYKHLVAKYKRLVEKSEKTEEMLREYQRSEKSKRHDEESELHRLRQKVRTLQKDNYDLIQSRDRAEELCERRESEALRDMTELQQLHRDIVDEEKQRCQTLTEELQRVQREADRHVEESVYSLQQMLKEAEEENNALRRKLERHATSSKIYQDEITEDSDAAVRTVLSASGSFLSFPANSSPRSKMGCDSRTMERLVVERQRLQQENDRLSTELQQMEVRAEARDAENNKIQRLLKEYERGDEGIRRLRNELVESNRSMELLQEENAQLRERLNAMEDSLTFSTALQELCVRIGVTQEEIDRLRPKNSSLFSEVGMLREEVATLKDEVEWLEKERRHWMDKVRLQPLLDTKLRLELGLSPEQLKQLDHVVDQMKSGRHIVEEDEGNYREKYFQELQLRRKEMEHFNDFVRQRIEEALREALGKTDFSSAPDATSALQILRDRVDLITVQPNMETGHEAPSDAVRLREQLRSALQLLEQSELTIKDNATSQVVLREQLAAVTAERDVLMDERDKYRTAVFDALGVSMPPPPTEEQRGQEAVEGLFSATVSDAPSQTLSQALRCENTDAMRSGPLLSISRTFEEQLRIKDELIASLKNAVESVREEAAQHREAEAKATRRLQETSALQEDLRNQVLATQQINEELNGKLVEQQKILEDLQDAMRRIDSGNTRELLQKIVVLRQREGKLLQRLRCVMETQEEASRSEQAMREYVNTTFTSLKGALENTSTGFVLQRSSKGTCVESGILEEMQQRLDSALRGKLFKEDSTYLLQLRQTYHYMEQVEELSSLRKDLKIRQKQMSEMEIELGELRIELDRSRKLQDASSGVHIGDPSQAAKFETEATTWRQKCSLYMKRYEDKEREVSTLEAELEDTRGELALLQEHLHNGFGGKAGLTTTTRVAMTAPLQKQEQEQEHEQKLNEEEEQQQQQLQSLPAEANDAGDRVQQLERDVARLKSINLGLLHHSMDLQGDCKRLSIQLEATKQELSLVRDAGDSRTVSDFVSAAIRQHAALRRQSELALLRAKRARMQLCATEANLRVTANEATTYKLSAFRLYRKYVAQMVSVLDYVRSVQRDLKGFLSPHRAEIMHLRLLDVTADLERGQVRQNELAAQLAKSNGMVSLLQQQLDLAKTKDEDEHADALHSKLLASLSAVREKDAQLAELREDQCYIQQKLKRAEVYSQQLTEEVTRLELRASGVASLDEDVVQKLLQLQETVFAKAESPAVVIQPSGVGPQYMDDAGTDTAIREYKQALDKQAELTRECASLKKRLGDEATECRKAQAVTDTLKEEVNRLQERLQYVQRQLEEERQKAEERERRVIRSHEAQAEVAHRAAEHNSQCLREMLHNKEGRIKQLQEQLQAERRKYLEYQLEEAARMERLHDHLFKENNAMVERFREAISGVAENYTFTNTAQGAGVVPPDGVAEQLALLTRETLRLKSELKDARATNIMLEGQLNEQVAKAQPQFLISHQGGHQTQQGMPAVEASVVGVVNDQNAIIESLRQREFSLTRELQRGISEREVLEKQLNELRHVVVEQGGVLKSAAVAGTTTTTLGSVVEQELRAQLTFVESQLSEARVQLEEERQNTRRLQADTTQWRAHLDALREEVVAQQADVERARRLVAMNDSLNADIRLVEEQNEKLIMATNMLKQRLVEEAQQRGDASRKHQHELALAQRMGSIQLESTEQLKAVTERLRSIQCELEEKVRREEEALKKHEEAQRMAYELHRQLQEREQEILRLKRELASCGSPSNRGVTRGGREKGTQVLQSTSQEETKSSNDLKVPAEAAEPAIATTGGLPKEQQPKQQQQQQHQQHEKQRPRSAVVQSPMRALLTDVDANALAQPQIAALLRREVEKAQRDNLHEISSLRALTHRLESDLQEARDHLRGERETSRSLRVQMQNAQRELEAKELAITREYADRQQRPEESRQVVAETEKPPATSVDANAVRLTVPQGAVGSKLHNHLQRLREENEQLKRQVERLKKRVAAFDDVAGEAERYKTELADLRCRQKESVEPIHVASPLDIRHHKRTVLRLENTIDELKREVSVTKEAQLRNLQRRIDDLTGDNKRLTAELSRYQAATAVMPSSVPLRTEKIIDQSALERELLEKNSTILDLRFEQETLQLKVGRLERHIQDILQVDSTNTNRTGTFKQRGRVEALESVVENLKLVVDRLQHENGVLKSKSVSMSKHMDLLRELRELRASERQLREHTEKLTRRLMGSAAGGSAMCEQQARLQRRLQTAQATAEQYRSEVMELQQRLDDRQEGEGDDSGTLLPGQRGYSDPYSSRDRRSVQPLDLSAASDLPPPLPTPPVTEATGDSAGYSVHAFSGNSALLHPQQEQHHTDQ
ncbi:mushroom body defect [Trypanosoma grayi]|uniref:mushroom body defect n=1 Tax=Trypanosoma grayi TaxID=71804 RepID=UPI0004F454D5|nr:mushroom body defect [Trypanosoma grayi]KEG11988.1 mushroom body defect [Trypanosoma grayi]